MVKEVYMDILKYVNSKDVREYLRSVEYKFSAAEAAWIVNRSVGLSLNEKIAAWNEIMNTMPDCRLESPYNGEIVESFYSLLKAYVDLKNAYLEDFRKCDDKEYYEYCFKRENRFHTLNRFFLGPYNSCDDCLLSIRKDIETGKSIIGYSIRKSKLGTHEQMFCEYSYEGKLLDIEGHDLKGYDKEEYYRILHLFSNMWPDIPVPYKKGDLLRYVSRKCQDDEKLTVMNDLKTKYKDNVDIFGDEDKVKHLFGYCQTDIGSLCEKSTWGHYIDYEYCPEESLKGKQRILVSLSHYLKGSIPLECFVNDYHLIMLKGQMEDIRSEQMFSRASMDI
jgi:hypothetical protein